MRETNQCPKALSFWVVCYIAIHKAGEEGRITLRNGYKSPKDTDSNFIFYMACISLQDNEKLFMIPSIGSILTQNTYLFGID